MVAAKASRQQVIRVLVVDDHQLIRDGISAVLSTSALETPFEASNGREAVEAARKCRPHVVLMDILMPEMDGIEACRRIKEHSPEVAVIMLSSYEDPAYLKRALEAGASGYLLKGASRDALLNAIESVLAGNTVIDSALLGKTFLRLASSGASEDELRRLSRLTPRELEILRLVAEGRTNEEIAREVSYSVGTVKNAVQSIVAKLEVVDRVQAAVLAARAGILAPS